MKNIILIFLFGIALQNLTLAQTKGGEVFTVVEKMPEFKGGDKGLVKYLMKNTKYPKTAKEAGTKGTVYVNLTVETDGSLTNVKVLRGITGTGGKDCDTKALRVVNTMPAWNAGTQNGKAVRVSYNLPIRFGVKPPKPKKNKPKPLAK